MLDIKVSGNIAKREEGELMNDEPVCGTGHVTVTVLGNLVLMGYKDRLLRKQVIVAVAL
jgi:hypothetical protein